jgi:FKBP-type peptidyl-prolyl cis-trans isomerase
LTSISPYFAALLALVFAGAMLLTTHQPAAGQTEKKLDGPTFLAETAKKAGVQKTASGLLYEIVKAGDGPKPKATDMVKVHYRGTLIDGREFDSSYKRNEPAVFPVNRVITGWHEALQLMPVGSKWKLYIPSELAYGKQGAAGGLIPPDSVLLFDVELLSIE